jgi:hypothetical protein
MKRPLKLPAQRDERQPERGQAIVLFALLLVVVLGAAGILVDGGMAWANRRQAQAAADFAALAAAKAIVDGGSQCNASGLALAQAAADQVAALNGFDSVTVQYPATSSSHTGCSYVRVAVSRSMSTTFSRVVGQTTWTAQASAVASLMTIQAASVANCTFCSLNGTDDNHTLLVQLGSTLIVDGDIYVNSSNGLKADDPNSAVKLKDWYVGGDGFDIFGAGGRIEAERIFTVGGWETHDGGIALARTADCPASQRPDPLAYATLNPPITSNVCIHQPALSDPLANFPVPNPADYPAQSTKKAKYSNNATYTLLPGVYTEGIEISGNAIVIMTPGMYYMAGGGFSVKGNASVTATGVTVYSGSESGKKGKAGDIEIETKGTVVFSPPTSGAFAGMTLYMERTSDKGVILEPNSTVQCATANGCIGGLSGTIYAGHSDSVVSVKAAGTANLQVLSGRLLVTNGSTARFTHDATGFASASTSINLVE